MFIAYIPFDLTVLVYYGLKEKREYQLAKRVNEKGVKEDVVD